jgi:hypothetical protein
VRLPAGRQGLRNAEWEKIDGEIRISGNQGDSGLGAIIECGEGEEIFEIQRISLITLLY